MRPQSRGAFALNALDPGGPGKVTLVARSGNSQRQGDVVMSFLGGRGCQEVAGGGDGPAAKRSRLASSFGDGPTAGNPLSMDFHMHGQGATQTVHPLALLIRSILSSPDVLCFALSLGCLPVGVRRDTEFVCAASVQEDVGSLAAGYQPAETLTVAYCSYEHWMDCNGVAWQSIRHLPVG